jgi:AraC-like DNA-binding protein/ribosomal protein S18 acetylase RimI-like enzyme
MIKNQTTIIKIVIEVVETHLKDKLNLEIVANAVNYSKYHIHRMFNEMFGITIHDYVKRRQLTEAAKLLVFSNKTILEIAFMAGYESQQAFTAVFKEMYKKTPAQYRENQEFYPLQLRLIVQKEANDVILKTNIRFATKDDIPAWMKLVRLAIDGYPNLEECQYIEQLKQCIDEKRALILYDGEIPIGVLAFSYDSGSIDFLGVHPQYRKYGITKILFEKLMDELIINKKIYITTFREHDKADTGYRKELQRLGFVESELLVEFGYPTQRFVLSPKIERKKGNE